MEGSLGIIKVAAFGGVEAEKANGANSKTKGWLIAALLLCFGGKIGGDKQKRQRRLTEEARSVKPCYFKGFRA